MERLRAVGEAIGRSVTAGHWPGQGPNDERLTQIADNISRARHLVETHGRPSQQAAPEMERAIQDLHGQVMHTLYVAAHGTAVALGGHVAELQHRLEAGARRRQRLAERPTALEITAAQDMIVRFDGFEQLAGAYLFGLPATSANGHEDGCDRGPGPGVVRRGGDHYRSRHQPSRRRSRCCARGSLERWWECGGAHDRRSPRADPERVSRMRPGLPQVSAFSQAAWGDRSVDRECFHRRRSTPR
jgi:hypothetical protein